MRVATSILSAYIFDGSLLTLKILLISLASSVGVGGSSLTSVSLFRPRLDILDDRPLGEIVNFTARFARRLSRGARFVNNGFHPVSHGFTPTADCSRDVMCAERVFVNVDARVIVFWAAALIDDTEIERVNVRR